MNSYRSHRDMAFSFRYTLTLLHCPFLFFQLFFLHSFFSLLFSRHLSLINWHLRSLSFFFFLHQPLSEHLSFFLTVSLSYPLSCFLRHSSLSFLRLSFSLRCTFSFSVLLVSFSSCHSLSRSLTHTRVHTLSPFRVLISFSLSLSLSFLPLITLSSLSFSLSFCLSF